MKNPRFAYRWHHCHERRCVDRWCQSRRHKPIDGRPIHIDDDVELIVEDIFNLPSPHIAPEQMLQIKERIQLAHLSGIDGVVVTHGTDTLEETAFF